jgi:hypothetical protein
MYREVTMLEIQEVLRLRGAGLPKKRIAGILDRVPDVPPVPGDALPESPRTSRRHTRLRATRGHSKRQVARRRG